MKPMGKLEENLIEKFDKEFDYECLTERPWSGDSLGEKIESFLRQELLS